MHECTIVILGATGDLTRRKLIPALYTLLLEKKVKKIAIVGVSNVATSADEILKQSKKYV